MEEVGYSMLVAVLTALIFTSATDAPLFSMTIPVI
jgi:hypothetical protein